MSNLYETLINNPDFKIWININLDINKNYLKKMSYPYPYSTFGINLLGKKYGKIYSSNENNEFEYSLKEFKKYFDLSEGPCFDSFLSIDICSVLQDPYKENMYNVNSEVLKCKLVLNDISYSDKIISLEAEIL